MPFEVSPDILDLISACIGLGAAGLIVVGLFAVALGALD